MRKSDITRREFLILSGAVTAALVTVRCDGGGGSGGTEDAFRLSLRGRRGSNAAKSHNANLLFSSVEAADANRAHPGDNSRIVPIRISRARFNELFRGNSSVADLRDF